MVIKRKLLTTFAALCCLASVGVTTASAQQLLVLKDGRVYKQNDRYLTTPIDPAEATVPLDSRVTAFGGKSVSRVLKDLKDAGKIDKATYDEKLSIYKDARKTYKKLSGTRKAELGAVIALVKRFAADGKLTTSRIEPVFLTLKRNREWWATGSLLSYGQRVSFSGSKLVFQYYPGQGIQIQMLASFGKLNAYWSVKKTSTVKKLATELIGLAAERGGGLAWEYYFTFNSGTPPWISALSQGTAIQSLARASDLTGDTTYLDSAKAGVGVFETAPPTGLRVGNETKARYLMYSFNSDLYILNGFIQSLVGIYDYATIANDDHAMDLFKAGDKQAREDTEAFDTGAWSLYSQYKESDLGYHKLVRDFLKSLCKRTSTDIYCDTADNFTKYLTAKPTISLKTKTAKRRKAGKLTFKLSKISKVSITVKNSKGVVYSNSVQTGYGTKSFSWTAPKRKGKYTVTLSATDLAGNTGSSTGSITVK